MDETTIERRQRTQTLTEADLQALKDLISCNKCSFSHEEADTLHSIARNTNRAASLATKTIITGMVLGTLSLIWFALKHVIMDVINHGAVK